MVKLVKTDINILIHKKGFQITVVLILTYALWVTVYYAMLQKGLDVSELYHPVKLTGLNSVGRYTWFFCKWFPFLVVIPAGFSIVNDKNTRIRVLIKSRVGNEKYYVSKLISTFVVTFMSIVIPFIIQCMVNVLVFPKGANKDLTGWETYSDMYFEYADNYLFSELYYENIYIYFLVGLVITGVFAGCLAVFLVGISTFEFKYKAFLFLPIYLLFYVIEALTDSVNNITIYLNEYITLFDITRNKSLLYYFTLMLTLLVVGVLLTVYNAQKKERVD